LRAATVAAWCGPTAEVRVRGPAAELTAVGLASVLAR
jgi:hypothetical protein